jgi:hypothetical protein
VFRAIHFYATCRHSTVLRASVGVTRHENDSAGAVERDQRRREPDFPFEGCSRTLSGCAPKRISYSVLPVQIMSTERRQSVKFTRVSAGGALTGNAADENQPTVAPATLSRSANFSAFLGETVSRLGGDSLPTDGDGSGRSRSLAGTDETTVSGTRRLSGLPGGRSGQWTPSASEPGLGGELSTRNSTVYRGEFAGESRRIGQMLHCVATARLSAAQVRQTPTTGQQNAGS